MSLAGHAARGAAATYIAQVLRLLIQVLSIVVLSRLLTPYEYGSVTMVLAVIGIAGVLGDFGLSMAAIHAQDLTNIQRSNLFWINVALGVALGIGVYLSAEPISAFYGRPDLVPVTQVLSIVFVLAAFTPQLRAEASKKLKFRWLAMSDVVAQAAGFAVAIATALLGYGYWALVWNQIVVATLTLILVAIGARWIPGWPRKGAKMKGLLAYGANTLGVQVLTYVTSSADSILIGRFNGSAELGVYSRASQLFKLPLSQVASSMTPVAMPILSRLQADTRYDAYVQRAQLVFAYGVGGMLFVLAAAADPVVDIMLGPNWGDAKLIFQVLAIGGVFQALGYVYYWIFLSRGFTGLQLRFSLIGRIAMLVLMVVGVIWGPLGVAAAASAGQLLLWALNSFMAIPQTGVAVKPLLATAGRATGLYVGLFCLSVPISRAMGDSNEWLHLAAIIALTIAYLGVAYIAFKWLRRDLSAIWDTAKRIRQ